MNALPGMSFSVRKGMCHYLWECRCCSCCSSGSWLCSFADEKAPSSSAPMEKSPTSPHSADGCEVSRKPCSVPSPGAPESWPDLPVLLTWGLLLLLLLLLSCAGASLGCVCGFSKRSLCQGTMRAVGSPSMRVGMPLNRCAAVDTGSASHARSIPSSAVARCLSQQHRLNAVSPWSTKLRAVGLADTATASAH